MNLPKTLLEMSGVQLNPTLKTSILLLIDYQNEYLDGELPLFQIAKTLQSTQKLIAMAKQNEGPIIYVVQKGNKDRAVSSKFLEGL